MRKFISILSAASIAATSFVAAITAQAEGETVLYSDSFNGYNTSSRTETGIVFAAQAGGEYAAQASEPSWQWIFNSPASRALDKLTVGFDGGRGDDTGTIMIYEKEDASDKYLSMPKNRFQSRMKPQITGFDQYAANEGEDLVIAFDLMLSNSEDAAELDLGLGTTITTSTAGVTENEWVSVKAVTSDGTTTVYVDGTEAFSASGAVSILRPQPFAGDTKLNSGHYPTVNVDNLVIMSAADGATAEIPAAKDQDDEFNPPAPEVVPAATIPDDAAVLGTSDFEDVEIPSGGRQRIVIGPGGATANWGDFTFSVGSRNDANGGTAAEVLAGLSNGEPNKYVQLLEGDFASGARGPKVKLADAPAIEEGQVFHETFALKLNAASEDKSPAIYLIDGDDTVNSSTDNRYMYVYAAITTGEAANPSLMSNGGTVTIPADQWVLVDFELQSSGQYNIYIDGELAYEHTYTSDKGVYRVQYNNSGDYQITPNKLPSIVVAWDKPDSAKNGTKADIDNLVAYSTGGSTIVKENIPAVEVPAGATSIGSANFDNINIGQGDSRVRVYTGGTGDYASREVNDLTMSAGGQGGDTHSETAAEVKAKASTASTNNKVLELLEGRFASGARGPLVQLTTPAKTTDLTDEQVLHEAFALKLEAAKDDATPAIYFVEPNAKNNETDNRYMYVFGAVTTSAEGLPNLMSNGGVVEIPADTWVVVDLALEKSGKYTISVNGEVKYEHTYTSDKGVYRLQYNNSGDYQITPDTLPGIVLSWDKADAAVNGTIATIDNFEAYVTGPESDVWTKYAATYDNGVLAGVTITYNIDPTVETADPANGVFIWNQKMKPYVAE